ncbi:CaiB/BaiF CoA transferase family protein [Streptomyces melanosporofaciens]|uniref:Alpha-methylacyl-CoA racemase n=1 Tax=Streptomyces melanosporofaciens TaxID=67327 RepID=A0A1H4I9H6_STRMJ|nr:CaiB/BaiF CoA-transferase family protein [Streptomyces melanosporofaciens]SEB30376.1 alpha-methylacyl-CoA racemase [Streptomyces melanosporofaciens]
MGPLDGTKVIEMAGLGPVPFCAMMLADMGADVVRIEGPVRNTEDPHDRRGPIWRGRSTVSLDLKNPADLARAKEILGHADVVLEGFRPGVMERLGLGPDTLLAGNPALVYGRMTGWGQSGPLASEAGHDINYLAVAGVLRQIGRAGERPVPPLNLVGDYGGGGMLLTVGVLAALLERTASGRGQVIDAAMMDGAALLMTSVLGWMARGQWAEPPGSNIIDTGAPFYEVYETADLRHLAFGAVEPRFYKRLVSVLGFAPEDLPPQYDRHTWAGTKERFARVVARRTLAEWVDAFEGQDACVSPVLTLAEAADHPHLADRRVYTTADGTLHVAPAPRFSRTPSQLHGPRAVETPSGLVARWKAGEAARATDRP